MSISYKDHGHPPGWENEHDPRCQACAEGELAEMPGSAFLVQKLGRLLQMPEREWTEKDILEACRDLVARYKHTMARCQDAAQKYRLGLGGEPVDRLVLDELHRLKKARPSAQGEESR